jgi:hypothetical protein
MVRIDYLILTQLRVPNNHLPLPGHVQQLITQMSHFDAFSNVVEHVFLLQQDNVIPQALLDSWGESDNPCTIYALPMVPLTPLWFYLWQNL